MVVAKNPGIGRGRGGGRPTGKSSKPPRQVEEVRLRLTPQVADLLRRIADEQGIPAWKVVESAILGRTGANTASGPERPGAKLPPEVMEIACEAASFLADHEDRPAALEALRRAWKQALGIARLEVQSGTGADSKPISQD